MNRVKRARRTSHRGGRGGHEPRARILERERRAVELSIQGWQQHQIAAELGVSQPAVSKILARTEDRRLQEIAQLVSRHKARQEMRLEHLFGQAMRAWNDSKTDATKRRQRQTHAGPGQEQQLAELVSENRHGDPRYLAEARGALRDLRTLFGLDAPTRVLVAGTPFESMSDAALEEAMLVQRHLLAAGSGHTKPVITIKKGRPDGQ